MKRLVLLLLLVSGCKIGPNYHRPCLEIPPSYHFEPEEKEHTLNTLWWEQFDDPVLIELVEQALLYNDDIRIASANIEQALGFLIQTRSDLFPQIGYLGTATRERLAISNPLLNNLIDNPFSNYEVLGTATWNINVWGRIRRLVESARADFFSTVQAQRNVVLSIVASVANAYLQLRGFDEQLVIAQKTLQTYQEALDYFNKQFAYGQTSQMSVAQAATQVEIAAAAIPEIELQIVQTENALSVLLGKNPGEIPRGKPIREMALPNIPSGLPSDILLQRPDIAQSEQELIAANAQIGAARALYFPNISLTGAYGNNSFELKHLFTGPNRTWNYAGSIIGPIFTFGAISGAVMQAEGQTNAALYNYKLAIKTAFSEIETALASRMYYAKQLEAQGRLVNAASEYTHLANLQYKAGYSPYFVVLQAQEQLFPAELQWVQTRVLLLSSLVNIYQSMGGGWVISAEKISRGNPISNP